MRLWAFLGILLAGTVVHAVLLYRYPVVHSWGDEYLYALCARQSAEQGVAAALPGFLPYLHRQSLACGVYAFLVPDGIPSVSEIPLDTPYPWPQSAALTTMQQRVGLLNLGLFAVAAAALFLTFRRDPPVAVAAALAVAVLYALPGMMFYVQALWPEMLHLALVCLALGLATAAARADRSGPAVAAGAAFGGAMLTKGIVTNFLPVIAAAAVVLMLRDGRSRRRCVRYVAALALGVAVVIGPQATANAVRHDTLALAHNAWRNIQLGLLPDQAAAERNYVTDPAALREARARERVMTLLRDGDPGEVLRHRITRTAALVFGESFFDWGVRFDRWAGTPELAVLAAPGRWASAVLIVAGWAGMLWALVRRPETCLFALYAMLYSASLAAVGHNPRFVVQLVPFAAFFAALLALDAGGRAVRSVCGGVRVKRFTAGFLPSLRRNG